MTRIPGSSSPRLLRWALAFTVIGFQIFTQAAESSPPEDLLLQEVLFDRGDSELSMDGQRSLVENVRRPVDNPDQLVLIEGHAANGITAAESLLLGERRAGAVMRYLVAQGVASNRLTVITFGRERPVCSESTNECAARNRRVHFLTKPR